MFSWRQMMCQTLEKSSADLPRLGKPRALRQPLGYKAVMVGRFQRLGLALLLGGALVAHAAGEPRPLAVPAKFITALAPDGAGGFWAGTEDDGALHIGADLQNAQTFSATNGPGDKNIYAVAVDKLGRTWAGTLNHGVAVFNGKEWRGYDVELGPLGERVFAIACCPTDGDIWMATSAGLARYSVSKESWSYFTAWDSLSSDQAQSLAFDVQGNLYAGLQCGGVAVARAAERYQKWTTYAAPWYRDEGCRIPFPIVPLGKGLPNNFINQVLLLRDGTLCAATTAGLAWSRDGAKTWRHIRGQDFAAKVKGLWGGAPEGWKEPDAATQEKLLPADFVTALAENVDGKLWVGSRDRGAALFDLAQESVVRRWQPSQDGKTNVVYISALLALPDRRVIAGTYGHGLWLLQDAPAAATAAPATPTSKPPPLPADAVAPGPATLAALEAQLGKLGDTLTNGSAVFVGEDWATQGDWCERYGSMAAFLCGPNKADASVVPNSNVTLEEFVGPNARKEEGPCVYIQWEQCDENPASLFFPSLGHRQEAEVNDTSFSYPFTQDGPDLWLKVNVPHQFCLISLYFHNKDAHNGRNRLRDYVIEVRHGDEEQTRAELFNLDAADPTNAPADFLTSSILARSRVRDFWGGVYKNFLVRGPGPFYFRIARHYSHVTTLAGVMVDSSPRIAGSKTLLRQVVMQGRGRFLGRQAELFDDLEPQVQAAMKLWTAGNRGSIRNGGVAALRPIQCFAYRAAATSTNTPPELLDLLRTQIPLWDAQDHSNFWNSVRGRDQ
jgi:hypothetical protein